MANTEKVTSYKVTTIISLQGKEVTGSMIVSGINEEVKFNYTLEEDPDKYFYLSGANYLPGKSVITDFEIYKIKLK